MSSSPQSNYRAWHCGKLVQLIVISSYVKRILLSVGVGDLLWFAVIIPGTHPCSLSLTFNREWRSRMRQVYWRRLVINKPGFIWHIPLERVTLGALWHVTRHVIWEIDMSVYLPGRGGRNYSWHFSAIKTTNCHDCFHNHFQVLCMFKEISAWKDFLCEIIFCGKGGGTIGLPKRHFCIILGINPLHVINLLRLAITSPLHFTRSGYYNVRNENSGIFETNQCFSLGWWEDPSGFLVSSPVLLFQHTCKCSALGLRRSEIWMHSTIGPEEVDKTVNLRIGKITIISVRIAYQDVGKLNAPAFMIHGIRNE